MKKLDEILAGKKSVGLAGHVRPDGDCVGSTLGVYNYIRKYYPDVDVRLYLEMRNVWGMLHVIFRKQSIQPVLTTMSVTRVLQRKIIFSRMQVPLVS